MSVEQAYNQWSVTYDTDHNLTRDLSSAITRDLLRTETVGTLLELGCGTGRNTPFYASISQKVLALDFSAGMMRQAQAAVQAPNVQFVRSDFTQAWPLVAASVDLIACNLVLEHLPDLRFVFQQAARVLSAGGHFLLVELHPFRQYQGKKAVFQGADGPHEITAYTHHLSDFTQAAMADFELSSLREWWHDTDSGQPPRLVSFQFAKR